MLDYLRGGVSAVVVAALAGCQTNPATMYRTGYDRMLTPERWAVRPPDQSVVIIGGAPALWYKADEPSYGFQSRPRYRLDARRGYDVALVKPGRYQLQTLVLAGNQLASFGAISGLGQSGSENYAAFTVKPGEVVYVGEFDAISSALDAGLCIASMDVRDNTAQIQPSFRTNVPYVTGPISTRLMTIEQDNIRFPAPCH